MKERKKKERENDLDIKNNEETARVQQVGDGMNGSKETGAMEGRKSKSPKELNEDRPRQPSGSKAGGARQRAVSVLSMCPRTRAIPSS